MGYQLNHNVHFSQCGDDIVFLDLNRSRYQMVSGSTAATLRNLMVTPNVHGSARQTMEKLVLQGLLRRSESPNDRPLQSVQHPFPDNSLFRGRPLPFRGRDVIGAVWTQVQVGQALKRAPLLNSIDRLRHDQTPEVGMCRRTSMSLEDASAAFFYSRRLLPCHNKCLRTAIAMVAYLARRGLPAQLVIGVKKGPFGVHAWAQSHATALSDTLDNILPFQPIFVC